MRSSVYELDVYETMSGKKPFCDFLHTLYKEGKVTEVAQIKTYLDRLSQHGMGINNYYPKTIRKVSDKDKGIWELRPGGNRVFFFHFTKNKIVLLHGYQKHSQKAPPSEIRQAENEMKDYLRREANEHEPHL